MATRYVVDTNVLVYALDRREPEKRERAREVLRLVGGAGTPAPLRDPLQTPVEDLQRQFARLHPASSHDTVARFVSEHSGG
jgi:hypothetical protein